MDVSKHHAPGEQCPMQMDRLAYRVWSLLSIIKYNQCGSSPAVTPPDRPVGLIYGFYKASKLRKGGAIALGKTSECEAGSDIMHRNGECRWPNARVLRCRRMDVIGDPISSEDGRHESRRRS